MDNNYSAKKQISITHTLDEAWSIMLANFGSICLLLFVFFLIVLLAAILVNFYADLLSYYFWTSDWGGYFFKEFMGTIATIATASTTLKLADGQQIGIRDLFSKLPLFFKILAGEILYLLAVMVGLICLIVPGIILAIRLSLFDLYIIDQGCGPIQALKKSWETLKGFSWSWLGFGILSFLIVLLGLLCLGVGLLFAWPTTVIARALLYRKLTRISLATLVSPPLERD